MLKEDTFIRDIMHDPIVFPDPNNLYPESFPRDRQLETSKLRSKFVSLSIWVNHKVLIDYETGLDLYLSLKLLFVNVSHILWALVVTPAIDGME